jgi:phosphate:Na+ symporter
MLVGGLFALRYGLSKLFLSKFQYFLKNLTVTPWRGTLLGVIITAIVQSSTAISLITIGLVSANYLSLTHGISIILGANIGTCSTLQLMRLDLALENFVPFFLLCLLLTKYNSRPRKILFVLLGLCCMLGGLNILTTALGSMASSKTLLELLSATATNPAYGILSGIIMTLLFQSSSAATGLLMLLAQQGLVSLVAAVYVVYGNNIGSCLSSVIIGTTAPLAARQVAISHIVLNVLGVFVFFPFTNCLAEAASILSPDFATQVAIVHTIFNVISSLIVLPVVRQYTDFIIFVTPGKK